MATPKTMRITKTTERQFLTQLPLFETNLLLPLRKFTLKPYHLLLYSSLRNKFVLLTVKEFDWN